MRSQKEITKEIETLRAMKPTVRKFSGFGDNHHDAIEAQIKVLEERMDENEVYNRFEDDAENEQNSAREAANWLHEENDEEAPHKGWENLVVKPYKK